MSRILILKRAAHGVSAAAAILSVAVLIIFFKGGIGIGSTNHVGLLPVVRRILDPGYLAGDFGITLRLYHHREFALIIAGLAQIMGEDRGLIALSVASTVALSAALYCLSRVLRLPLSLYLLAGLFLALRVGWTGRGFEQNVLVGDWEINPTTAAHAFVLFAAAALVSQRYRLAAFCVGLTLFFHLQVGAILAILAAPFFAVRLRRLGAKELLWVSASLLAPACVPLWHTRQMVQRGLLGSEFSRYYIDFRMPGHFHLASAGTAVWIAVHLLVQIAAYWWLRREARSERHAVGVLLTLSLLLTALCLAHFAEYYLLNTVGILKFQFIRLSPVITLFGALALITALNAWRTNHQGRGQRWRSVLVCASLAIAAGAQLIYSFTTDRPRYSIRAYRYVNDRTSWVEVCRWVDRNGPPGAIYLTPPGQEGFAYLANRSPVVEFKINPDGAQYLSEWFGRLRDMAGGDLPDAGGFDNTPLLNEAFASLRPEQLAALGNKYGARYAVLPRSSTADFEVVYQNEEYRVVELPE